MKFDTPIDNTIAYAGDRFYGRLESLISRDPFSALFDRQGINFIIGIMMEGTLDNNRRIHPAWCYDNDETTIHTGRLLAKAGHNLRMSSYSKMLSDEYVEHLLGMLQYAVTGETS